jgi:hypothetical protein
MAFTSRPRGLARAVGHGGRAARHRPDRGMVAPRRSFVPDLRPLEDRTLLSTFTVLNLNDSGPGSLRAEITAANHTPGASARRGAPRASSARAAPSTG